MWPGLVALLGFVMNMVMIGAGSTQAMPAGTFFALIALWAVFAAGNFLGRFLGRRGAVRFLSAGLCG